MKKILIMIMSCNQEHFLKQEHACIDTYLSRLPDNIDYVIYRGGEKTEYTNHILTLNIDDGLEATYQKTFAALKYVSNHFEYDYIFRTNTSTYVNIDLLNYFIQHTEIKDDVWGSEYAMLYDLTTYNLPYLRGNGLILSKKNIDILFEYGLGFARLNSSDKLGLIDDYIIGCVINSYWENRNTKPIDKHIKCYKEAWYKAILKPGNYPSSISNMNNDNTDFEYLKQFIVIQIRNWYDRTQENGNFKVIDEVFKNNKDNDIENTYKGIIEYSKNPDVFLGEQYGFYQYNKIIEKDDA